MRVLRIARVLKLLKMAKGIRALLDTVMQALPQVRLIGLKYFYNSRSEIFVLWGFLLFFLYLPWELKKKTIQSINFCLVWVVCWG